MAAPTPASNNEIDKEIQEFASGRYVVIGRLGRGGMGEVYRAEDRKLKRAVALKRLPPDVRDDPEYRQKLMQEAERASSLNCPNIAGLYDIVEEGSEVCLVMEFVEGTNLRQRLHQPMPLLTFLEVALQCTEALIAAHDRGIVHRDIKPENIMLTPSGRVKVLDFGLARQIVPAQTVDPERTSDETVSTMGLISGTVGYMSPETLLSRPLDARTDVFSLGVVFYEALTGRHPFRDATFMATADRVLHAEPPAVSTVNPQVPPTLDLVIERMIAKNAEDRYKTAHELRTALLNIQQQVGSGEWVPPLITPRRKRMLWSVAAVLALAIAGVWTAPAVFRLWTTANAAPLPQQMRVAVLPFRTIGGDSEAQAYSNGLTETLTARLTQMTPSQPLDVVSALEVHSRKVADVAGAYKDLGANLVLEGSVQHSGDNVRVNFALLDARTHRQLRAQTLTSSLQAGFAFEDEVAETVARMLDMELRAAMDQTAPKQPAGARALFLRGRGYLQDYDKPKEVEKAVAAFKEAIGIDPYFLSAYAGLGTAYWHQYNTFHDATLVDKAREACGRAITLDGSSPEAHECLGRVYNGTGQYENAVTELQRVLEKDATNDGAIRLLAKTYEALGRTSEAEQTYLKAVKIRPQYWAGYNALGGLYFRQSKYDEAAKAFEKATEVAPDSARGYVNLAGVRIEQRRYTEALPLLAKSITIDPSAPAYSNRGTVKSYLKDFDGAAADYEKALAIGGDDYELWGNLAEAYYWSKNRRAEAADAYAQAIRLASEAVRTNPRDAAVRAELAKYYAMHGEAEKAKTEIGEALKIAPKLAKNYFVAAVVEQQAGRSDSALAWLDKAVRAGYSPASVQDDPVFAALHADARFQKSVTQR